MITFKVSGLGTKGTLDNQVFTMSNDETTEKLLNAIAKAHPVTNGGSPNPDLELFNNVAKAWPFLTMVSSDRQPARHKGRIY